MHYSLSRGFPLIAVLRLRHIFTMQVPALTAVRCARFLLVVKLTISTSDLPRCAEPRSPSRAPIELTEPNPEQDEDSEPIRKPRTSVKGKQKSLEPAVVANSEDPDQSTSARPKRKVVPEAAPSKMQKRSTRRK
jgi:hypothetical protein